MSGILSSAITVVKPANQEVEAKNERKPLSDKHKSVMAFNQQMHSKKVKKETMRKEEAKKDF